MNIRTAITGTCLLTIVGLGCYGLRSFLMAGRQVRNWADIKIYVQFLEDYRSAHGNFPAKLTEAVPASVLHRDSWLAARDNYGNPLHYETDGMHFLLASFGRDGVRDRRQYIRQSNREIDDAPCQDGDIDTVYSSDGVRQLCGK